MNALDLDTVKLSEDGSKLVIIDQTKLPNAVEMLELDKPEDIWEAINVLRVRGAPAIGVCAGFAIYLAIKDIDCDGFDSFYREFTHYKEYFASSRPTAVNLFWALDRMEKALLDNKDRDISEIKDALKKEANDIRDEDIAISRKIGMIGKSLIKENAGILTHCNAGSLATAKYGTALAPIYMALEDGRNDFKVYCDETRPLLQGARLSAFEMQTAGVDTTLICDNMASFLMKNGYIDIIFVGSDRIASNGDAANKIGTSGVAILAKHYNIPIYFLAPTSTIDMSIENGNQIPIEMRDDSEVTDLWYERKMAPEGVKVINPAFDVTDHSLITGIITEKGLCHAPYDKAFKELGIK